ncbi:hypothetical protein Ciccas_004146 [Cichlidogyrus casuarinus]|uniref:Uncharacterized protein n=1 Tax=Cichlidogyrus casuarinus TaxID=1844966 RepID=A0ABD2QCD5_9PLAT
MLTLIFGGIPTLFLELLIGQTFSIGGLGVWKLCPLFKGVGYAAILMAFWLSIYYIVILAYALFYLFNSFVIGPLPWASCDNPWNKGCCTNNISCTNASEFGFSYATHLPRDLLSFANDSKIPILDALKNDSFVKAVQFCQKCKEQKNSETEYWKYYVLEESKGIDEPGSMRWPLAGCLLLAWVLCYFCIWRGVKWTGKVVYFTALFPYALLICLFFRGITLPGAMEGIEFYLKPNMTVLRKSKVSEIPSRWTLV